VEILQIMRNLKKYISEDKNISEELKYKILNSNNNNIIYIDDIKDES
jgi:hypothetical protein